MVLRPGEAYFLWRMRHNTNFRLYLTGGVSEHGHGRGATTGRIANSGGFAFVYRSPTEDRREQCEPVLAALGSGADRFAALRSLEIAKGLVEKLPHSPLPAQNRL